MRSLFICLLVVGLVIGVCAAAPLDGLKLTVEGGDQPSLNVPVSVPYDGPAPEKTVQVVDAKSGKAFPATVRDKALTFVLDSVAPKEKLALQVKTLTEQAAPKVAIAKKGEVPELAVVINSEPFTTYHYANDDKKPFLWPVYAEGKVTITRGWPMDPGAPGAPDHRHHKSIWTAYGDLNGVDCWDEGPNSGFQHSDEVTFGSGDAYGWVHAKNTWQDKEHKPVIAEEREYRFYAGPAGARLFDVTVTFTATYGKVKFGDTKEGGIVAFRIRPDLTENTKKGVITNASGAHGMKECWGKPSPWCDYSGSIEGAGMRGIAVFDNPANLRHPTCWHVRDYGLNGANCFGLSYFTNKKENGDYVLDEGKTLTFTYRVLIHSGDVQEAKIAERYADYTQPPKAAWAK
jgi:hypothetical protein